MTTTKHVAIITLIIIALGGCAGSPTPTVTVTAPAPSVSQEEPTATPEEQFIAAVEFEIGSINRPNTIDAGRKTCAALDVSTPDEFMQSMLDAGVDKTVLVPVTAYAVKYLCPEHMNDFKRYDGMM
jgi:hypothetical protein